MAGPSGQPISRRSLTHQKLLVIDDHPTFLVALAAVLRQEGHQVVVAPSGEDALALAAAERFDGVLVDRMMPGLDVLAAEERTPDQALLDGNDLNHSARSRLLPRKSSAFMDTRGPLTAPDGARRFRTQSHTGTPSR